MMMNVMSSCRHTPRTQNSYQKPVALGDGEESSKIEQHQRIVMLFSCIVPYLPYLNNIPTRLLTYAPP